MNEIRLTGCTPVQLMSNLKALGIFRIISEQADSEARGCWKNEVFVLETKLTENELIEFFLERYSPTPIVSPWNNGSGFYDVEQNYIDIIRKSDDKRLEIYRHVLKQADEILIDVVPEYKDFFKMRIKGDESLAKLSKNIKKITDDKKPLLLSQCRNRLSNDVVSWMDAAFVLAAAKPTYGIMLGTGGNDGNFEIASNFMEYVIELIIGSNEHSRSKKNSLYSRRTELIENSLYGTFAELDSSSFAYFDPGGYINIASSGKTQKESFVNPWDFLLTIEGTMLFAGTISRRSNSRKAAFPFTTNLSAAGYSTACEENVRGELWIPIWENPATFDEIKYVFGEGRAQIGSKSPSSGTDFVRAVASLGTERGFSAFQRFGLFERKGLAYFANNIGRIQVTEKPKASLFSDIDFWLYQVSKADKNPTQSMRSLLRSADSAIIKFCTYGKKSHLQEVLITVGKIERTVSRSSGYIKKNSPLRNLSYEWIEACYDDTPEFRLATSLAAISQGRKNPIRCNLEPVKIKEGLKYAPESPSAVWRNSDTISNMIKVLERRCIEGQMRRCVEGQMHDSGIPLNSPIPSPVRDVMDFIEGRLDYEKISDLLFPLSMIDYQGKQKQLPAYCNQRDLWTMPDFVPESYVALKSNFPPMSFKNKEVTKDGTYESTMIGLLRAGRIDRAADIGRRRLRITGYDVFAYPTIKKSSVYSKQIIKAITASMLFPLRMSDREKMTFRICNRELEQRPHFRYC